jgi:ATP-binding cassette subfamily B protein RaxB
MLERTLDFSGRRRLPVYLQAETAECGLACLAMIASYHRYRLDLNALRRRFPASLKGVTLKALMQIAEQLDLACRPLKFEFNNIRQLRLPAIVHWDLNHFVVLKAVTPKGILVHDPAVGEKFFSMPEASRHLTGVAV